MELKFKNGMAYYDDEVRELFGVKPSPMDDGVFMRLVCRMRDRQVGLINAIQASIGEEIDGGHRLAAGQTMLNREMTRLNNMNRLSVLAVEAAFKTVTPEEIIGR